MVLAWCWTRILPLSELISLPHLAAVFSSLSMSCWSTSSLSPGRSISSQTTSCKAVVLWWTLTTVECQFRLHLLQHRLHHHGQSRLWHLSIQFLSETLFGRFRWCYLSHAASCRPLRSEKRARRWTPPRMKHCHALSAMIFKLSSVAFRLAPPIGGVLATRINSMW